MRAIQIDDVAELGMWLAAELAAWKRAGRFGEDRVRRFFHRLGVLAEAMGEDTRSAYRDVAEATDELLAA